MLKKGEKSTVIVTGSAGFIGFHICEKLLREGWKVIGLDSLNDFYDVYLKKSREKILLKYRNYIPIYGKIEEPKLLISTFKKYKPRVVIHLAAQAGVRFSIKNPRMYLESNIIGTFELLEAARAFPPEHILMASTSSAYGANQKMPYRETDISDYHLSFYAASKKSSESMSHSYAHLFKIPITVFRFFTVYGPWGRPDMAYFKFTKKIINGDTIDVYNEGKMERDFTYVEDLSHAIYLLIFAIPDISGKKSSEIDSISPAGPFRIVNIGNSNPIKLMDFISLIEKNLDIKAKKNMLPMQKGDVRATWANTKLLKNLTGFSTNTNINVGIKKFIDWYKDFYQV